MRKPLRLAGAAMMSLALVAGCSNSPPSISRVHARVIYQHDPQAGTDSEGLSVFLVASDPNGMENLASFYVIDDDAELYWKVDSASWVTTTAEGETWIGSNTLVMPDTKSLPAGDYRVLLENDGGDTAEQSFRLPPREVSAVKAAYPSASVVDGTIRLAGPYPSVEIWTYGRDGKFTAAFPLSRKGPPLSVAGMIAASPTLALGFTFRVFADDPQAGYAVLSGPYTAGPIATAPPVVAPAAPAAPPAPTLPGR